MLPAIEGAGEVVLVLVGRGFGFLLFETKRVASSMANKSGSSSTVSISEVAVI